MKNKQSLGENHKAPSDQEKVKIKDVSNSENLFEAPKDGGLEFLPINQERYPMLIKEVIEFNTSTTKNPKIVLFVASLTKKEKPEF